MIQNKNQLCIFIQRVSGETENDVDTGIIFGIMPWEDIPKAGVVFWTAIEHPAEMESAIEYLSTYVGARWKMLLPDFEEEA